MSTSSISNSRALRARDSEGDKVLNFGKHKGLTYLSVCEQFPNYMIWLANERKNKDKELFDYVNEKLGVNEYYLTFGKYKGKTISQVYRDDKNYIKWLKEFLSKNQSGKTSELQNRLSLL